MAKKSLPARAGLARYAQPKAAEDGHLPRTRGAVLGAVAFPDALRSYRQQLGLTQAGLSARWGVPVRTIEDWEAGRRSPPEGPLRRLMELDQSPA